MRTLTTWRKCQKLNNARELKEIRRRLISMKHQLEKHNNKLVLLEVGEQFQKEKGEKKVTKVKESQDKVLHVETQQWFEEFIHCVSHEVSMGSCGINQVASIEEDTVEKNYEKIGMQVTSSLVFVAS